MSEQLHKDLERRVGEKLELWIKDAEELYDAGGLSSGHAHEAIIKQLIWYLCIALAKWARGVPEEQYVELFKLALHRAHEHERQARYDRRAT
jgi:hypothetical protein